MKYPGETYTRDELWAIINETRGWFGFPGRRDRAMVALAAGSGLRWSEVRCLQMDDLFFLRKPGSLVRVKHGKGGKYRLAWVEPRFAAIVADWVQIREKSLADRGIDTDLVFPSRTGKLLHKTHSTSRIKPKIKGGVPEVGRFHFHGLRHTFAFNSNASGVQLTNLQAQLGHSSLDMTSRYIARLSPEQRAEDFTAANPFGELLGPAKQMGEESHPPQSAAKRRRTPLQVSH